MNLCKKYAPDSSLFTRNLPSQQRVHETIESGVDGAFDTLFGNDNSTVRDDTVDNFDFDSFLATDESQLFSDDAIERAQGRGHSVDTVPGITTFLDADGEANAAEGPVVPRSREREGSPSEQARRRRRREAIVLNEGNRPLTQGDIIQRRRTDQ
jgi:hypothetical protein